MLPSREMGAKSLKPPRLILHNFLTSEECKELEFIHKSSSTVGYRPNVFSTTLSHLIATNSSPFLIPFVPIREKLKEKVENFFGCEYELCIEFTGLISWCRGACIGWHSDDNRPYLKQRHFTAVCYLNSYGKDFKGGLFHFQDGEPTTLVPMAGDVAIYTADSCNIHAVDEIIEGERLTLTLWFSRDSAHDEDAKLISLLSKTMLHSSINMPEVKPPMLASINMYWFSLDLASHQQLGFDICLARMHVLGFDVCSCQAEGLLSDSTEILMEPLQLVRGKELFKQEFVNILHALQAVQFHHWKGSDLPNVQSEVQPGDVVRLSKSQQEAVRSLKSQFLKDHQAVEMIFSCTTTCSRNEQNFDWERFSATIVALKDYCCKLHTELLMSLPYWRSHGIIYSVPPECS
ncbi:Oxidoreductase [Salix suchowensis]|nr:Oxidoreductase [Salix suchowensis]